MTKAGERILRSIRQARAFVRREETEGFVVHPRVKVDVEATIIEGEPKAVRRALERKGERIRAKS